LVWWSGSPRNVPVAALSLLAWRWDHRAELF
jgi:hypothetical protein